MEKPVVITRPRGQADALAHRVEAIGRTPVIFPLLEIHPLADASELRRELSDLRRYAMVAFVSPNAIDAAFGMLTAWPQEVPLAVMGEGSRKALAAHGVTDANATIISPRDVRRTDSQTLLQVLDLPALKGRQVLIVRGETGRELLADELRAGGVSVTQVAAYRRQAPVFDSQCRSQLMHLLAQECDWIVTSSEALRNLVWMGEQCAEAGAVAKMQQQRILVPHRRIAETAQMLGFRHITLSGSGDESLIAALQSEA